MSVWRITDIDDNTRKQAKDAADRAGVPLGAWLEAAIMRRTQSASAAAGAAKPDATPAVGADSQPHDLAAPAAGTAKTGKRKRGKKRGKAAASGDTATAPAAASADASADASSAASADAKDETAAGTMAVAAVLPPPDTAVPADDVSPPPADESATTASTPDSAEIIDQASPPDVASVPPDDAPPPTTIATDQPTAVAPPPSRLGSPTAWIALLGLLAIIVVGGYFLFLHEEEEPSVAQNPAPPPAAASPKTPPANTATAPAPNQAPSPAPAPVAAPSATPAPSAPADPATAAKPPARPAGIPAPTPGVQPSLLVPVPGSDDAPSAAIAPPAPDFQTRPGPVVAQKDNIAGLTKRAEAGDVDAQIELGKRYMQGTGTPANPALALRWLEKAAEAGNGQAQFNVGVMYERGIGATADSAKAISWYRKAAAQPVPVPTALHNLALLYASGNGGVTVDAVQARSLMTQAAELGLTESQYSLALMYFQGVGGAPDKVAALSWLALAARSNNPQMIQAAQQLAASMSEEEKAKALQLANQHVKKINDNIARLRAVANGSTTPKPAAPAVPAGKPLDRNEIAEMQRLLSALKLYTGAPDGAMGPKTEQAIREYQKMAELPVDGKATAEVLNSLRDVAGSIAGKPDSKP